MKKIFIIGLVLSLMGCVHAYDQEQPFSQPQFGMTKQQLIEASGKPDTIEIYQKPDKTRIEFYIYTKQYESSQTKVPVCLIDNKVVGWGKSFYEDHVSQNDTRIK